LVRGVCFYFGLGNPIVLNHRVRLVQWN
jgi:hypothetical protein